MPKLATAAANWKSSVAALNDPPVLLAKLPPVVVSAEEEEPMEDANSMDAQ